MSGARLTAAALGAALLLAPLASAAQSVAPCGDGPRIDTIAEPWEANTATYAGGEVRITLIDTAEPAAAAVHLAVIAPPRDELGLRRCRLVSLSPGSGFYDLDFAARQASYDPARGLVLTLPAQLYVPETGEGRPASLTVTVNQQSGEVTAALRP